MPALKGRPETMAAAKQGLLAPTGRMSFVRQQRYCQRLHARTAHLASQGEPKVPPRIADGETAVVSRYDLGVEKVGVEATTHGGRSKVGTDIDTPCEHNGSVQTCLQIGGHIGIADDPAIAVDDAGEPASAGPDRGLDGAYARPSVDRRYGELDRQIEVTQHLGFRRPIDRDGIETSGLP